MCIVVAVSDLLAGGYAIPAMSVVYGAHVLATLGTAPCLSRIAPRTIIYAGVLNAVIFFLFSNLTPMLMGYYANTLAGWLACYINALPYLLKGILANLVFGGIAFSLIAVIGRRYAHRFATS